MFKYIFFFSLMLLFSYSLFFHNIPLFYFTSLFFILFLFVIAPKNKNISKEMVDDLYQFKMKINSYKLFKDIYFFGDKYFFKSESEVNLIINYLDSHKFETRENYMSFYKFLIYIEKEREKNEFNLKYKALNISYV